MCPQLRLVILWPNYVAHWSLVMRALAAYSPHYAAAAISPPAWAGHGYLDGAIEGAQFRRLGYELLFHCVCGSVRKTRIAGIGLDINIQASIWIRKRRRLGISETVFYILQRMVKMFCLPILSSISICKVTTPRYVPFKRRAMVVVFH
jgi:hypothetical protein